MANVVLGFDTREPEGGLQLFRVFDVVLPSTRSYYSEFGLKLGDKIPAEILADHLVCIPRANYIIYFITDTTNFPGWLS